MRIITAKYSGTCCDCGSPIHVGDTIEHLGRGTARGECCTRSAPKQPTSDAPSASASGWDSDALSWDENTSTPTKPKPATRPALRSQRFIDTRNGMIVTSVPVSEIGHFSKYYGNVQPGEFAQSLIGDAQACRSAPEPVTVTAEPDGTLSVPAGTPDGAPVADIVPPPEAVEMARATITDLTDRILQKPVARERADLSAAEQHAADTARIGVDLPAEPEPEQRDPITVALIADLVTSIINAVQKMGPTERGELAAKIASLGNCAGNSERARLWGGISEAIR